MSHFQSDQRHREEDGLNPPRFCRQKVLHGFLIFVFAMNHSVNPENTRTENHAKNPLAVCHQGSKSHTFTIKNTKGHTNSLCGCPVSHPVWEVCFHSASQACNACKAINY